MDFKSRLLIGSIILAGMLFPSALLIGALVAALNGMWTTMVPLVVVLFFYIAYWIGKSVNSE